MNKERLYYIANKLNLNIKFKNKSFFMKCLGSILFFNKEFMTTFTTTIGNTVYFPNEEFLKNNNYDVFHILFHEKVHVNDGINNIILFKFLYLFPQILAPFFLLFCFYSWWIGLFLSALCLLPFPAYFRKNYELKAYKVSLFVEYEKIKEYGILANQDIKHINDVTIPIIKEFALTLNKEFLTGSYYFMWRRGVEKELNETVNKIISGDILKDDDYYGEVKKLMEESKNL